MEGPRRRGTVTSALTARLDASDAAAGSLARYREPATSAYRQGPAVLLAVVRRPPTRATDGQAASAARIWSSTLATSSSAATPPPPPSAAACPPASLACRQALAPRQPPHPLRRTFCTAALISGVPLRDMQYPMRPADARTTSATTWPAPTSTGTPPTASPPTSPAWPQAEPVFWSRHRSQVLGVPPYRALLPAISRGRARAVLGRHGAPAAAVVQDRFVSRWARP